ncbi:hypothetical protein [Dactylosporangium sp. NPDC048998]|uniref:hypothetical protein n=1 Tax=Dactylosporangium sp. NPDC048998 TaxID=3363976 RepID=UPI0037137C68
MRRCGALLEDDDVDAVQPQLDAHTPYVNVAAGMLLLGAGVGALLQNLVVLTQNAVEPMNIGAATASVTFFRSLGGAVGIAALGAVIQANVADRIRHSAAALPSTQRLAIDSQLDQGGILDPGALPDRLRSIATDAYGMGVGALFLLMLAGAFAVLAAVVALPPAVLSRATAVQGQTAAPAGMPVDLPGAAGWEEPFLWTGDTILLPVYTPSPRAVTRPPRSARGARTGPGGIAPGHPGASRRQVAPSWAAQTAEWPLVTAAAGVNTSTVTAARPAIRNGRTHPTVAIPRTFQASARVQ